MKGSGICRLVKSPYGTRASTCSRIEDVGQASDSLRWAIEDAAGDKTGSTCTGGGRGSNRCCWALRMLQLEKNAVVVPVGSVCGASEGGRVGSMSRRVDGNDDGLISCGNDMAGTYCRARRLGEYVRPMINF